MKNTRFLKEDAGKIAHDPPQSSDPDLFYFAYEIDSFENLPDTLHVARCCECQGRSFFFTVFVATAWPIALHVGARPVFS